MTVPKGLYGTAQAIEDEGLRVDRDEGPRCWRCNRKLAELLSRPWVVRCRRCHALNCSPGRQTKALIDDLDQPGGDYRPPCCWRCRHKLGEYLTEPYVVRCSCKAFNRSPGEEAAQLQEMIEAKLRSKSRAQSR